jgi:hypothetical protein
MLHGYVLAPATFPPTRAGATAKGVEQSVLVLSNAPRQRRNVAAIVKGAEARGYKLLASDVVTDARGADPRIVMVRQCSACRLLSACWCSSFLL